MKLINSLLYGLFMTTMLMAPIHDVCAAGIPFYQGSSTSMYYPVSRATLFQALDNVDLTAVGALVDPVKAPFNLRFCLYNSNASGGIIGSSIFDFTQSFAADNGWGDYNAPVNATLTRDQYYVIAVLGAVTMKRFDESTQSLPFNTAGSLFSVINGATWNLNPLVTPTWSSTILPALSVDAKVSAVPVPVALWLFGSGLLGLIGIRRKIRG